MKVLFILEAGIPEYRNFLFEKLANEAGISKLLILHTGKIYNGRGNYNSKKVRFVGDNKFGFHIGILRYIFKYDVIISSYNLRILTCWLPVFFKNKFIFWGKGLGSNEGNIVKFFRKITAKRAKYILVYNEAKKKELTEKIKIDERKLIAYTNTIYISNPGFDSTNKKEYFLYFGRIQKRKGLEELIRQYSLYVNKNGKCEPLKLRFVGNGEYTEDLKNIVKDLDLEQLIEFHQGVYDDISIKRHFEKAIAYVSPYNVGLSVVNSLAYGVPIITCEEPQVGPEFYYLNEQNSIILTDINQLYNTFNDLSSNDNQKFFTSCYNYFIHHLDSSIMYNNFINTIRKVWNE